MNLFKRGSFCSSSSMAQLFFYGSLFLFISFVYSDSVHGGTFLAMTGRNSVIIACDSRFSSVQSGSVMIGEFPRQIYRIGVKAIVGVFGLDNDAVALMDHVREVLSTIHAKDVPVHSVARVISDKLYSAPSMCSPIVAGLESNNDPYICCMDSLGAQTESREFAVVGTAASGLFAICESYYKPDLPPEEVVSIVEKCLSAALERDVLSGCKVCIFTVSTNGIYAKDFFTSDV